MKCGARVAGALATGYVLGRTKKMKFALMIGSWAAGQKLGSPVELLSKGTELLSKSPEFARLNEEVRVKLLDAGKSAIAAAAAQRLSTLTDSVGSSAERLATGGPLRQAKPRAAEEDDDGEEKPGRRSLLRFRRRGNVESAKVEEDLDGEDEPQDDELTQETDEPSDEVGAEPDDDTESAEDDQAADETPAPARRRRRAPAQKSPAEKSPAQKASTSRKAPSEKTSKGRSSAAKTRAAKPVGARRGAE